MKIQLRDGCMIEWQDDGVHFKPLNEKRKRFIKTVDGISCEEIEWDDFVLDRNNGLDR